MTKFSHKTVQINDILENNIIILDIFKVPHKKHIPVKPKYTKLYECMCLTCNDTKIIKEPKNGFYCKCRRRKKSKGLSKTDQNRLYTIWSYMVARCDNLENSSYSRYGGRGIKICNDWYDYEKFKQWAVDAGYKHSLTIDRINNNGNYEPNNCRWVTRSEQMNNTSSNRCLTFDGKTQTIAQWSKELNINYFVLYQRLQRGWSIPKALSVPQRFFKLNIK